MIHFIKNASKKTAAAFILLFPVATGWSQEQGTGKMFIRSLISEDSTTVNSIAVYPASTRKNILIACENTAIVMQMAELQKKTTVQFRYLLVPLEKPQQEKIWGLCRYPDLVLALAGEKKTTSQLEAIAAGYPADMKDDILEYGMRYHALFTKIDAFNQQNEKAFAQITADLSPAAKAAFTDLMNYPEVIDLLSKNVRTASLMGNIHQADAALLDHTLDSISAAYAVLHTKELEAWKTGMEKDGDAKSEMEAASAEFASYQGYDEYMETYDDDVYTRYETVYVTVVYKPYPWWLGYPWWYDYPCWYVYPWWYHCGYYCGPYGPVFIGMPSPYYMHWYLNNHRHHYQYNHFSNHCIEHYYGHRTLPSEYNREVSGWIRTNETRVPKHYFSNSAGRADRLKEYGKFETEYQTSLRHGKDLSREEFLKENQAKYPHMSGKPAIPVNKTSLPQQGNKNQQTPGQKQPWNKQTPVQKQPGNKQKPIEHKPRPAQPKNPVPHKPQPKNVPTQPKKPTPKPVPQTPRRSK